MTVFRPVVYTGAKLAATSLPLPGVAGISIKPGDYHYLSINTTTVTTYANVANQMRATPFNVSTESRISRLGGEIGTVGQVGSVFRMGVYRDNGFNLPGALELDAGTIDGHSATVQEVILDHTFAPGLYWTVGVCQLCPTTVPGPRGFITPTWLCTYAGTSIPTAGVTPIGVYQSGVTGALPSTFTVSGTMLYQSNGNGNPRLFAKGY